MDKWRDRQQEGREQEGWICQIARLPLPPPTTMDRSRFPTSFLLLKGSTSCLSVPFHGSFLSAILCSKQSSLWTSLDMILQEKHVFWTPPDICLILHHCIKSLMLEKLFHRFASFSSSVKTLFIIPTLKIRVKWHEECLSGGGFY